MHKKAKQVLWLPTGGQIGDALMILSALAEFLSREPEGKVIYLVRRNAKLISDLAAAYPQIRVIGVPENRLRAALFMLKLLLQRRYVVVVPPVPGNHPTEIKIVAAIFRLMSGNTVVGTRDRSTWEPYTVCLSYDTDLPNIENVRRLLAAGGIATARKGTPPLLKLDMHTPKDATPPQAYIVVHPFPTLPSKTLPMHRWRALLAGLETRYPDLSFIITGSKENASAVKEMSEGLPRVSAAIGLPILEVAWLIKNSALYIGVDTGITHLAGVLQHKSVIIAQRSSPTWLPYYNPKAKVLLNLTRCTCDTDKESCFVEEDGQKYYRCLYDIADETILASIHEKLF